MDKRKAIPPEGGIAFLLYYIEDLLSRRGMHRAGNRKGRKRAVPKRRDSSGARKGAKEKKKAAAFFLPDVQKRCLDRGGTTLKNGQTSDV